MLTSRNQGLSLYKGTSRFSFTTTAQMADIISMLGFNPLARESRHALKQSVRDRSLEPFRFHLAQTAFEAGRFDLALSHFLACDRDPELRGRSLLMQDWIAFHRGDVSSGWPRYPRAVFNEPAMPANQSGNPEARSDQGICVADPRSPHELTSELRLRRVRNETELREQKQTKAVVVWFNFKDSLGGELLACRLINALRSRCRMPLVLACNPRLVTLLQASFPDCRVVDKTGDLSELTGQCSHYVLARDLLGIIVQREEDFTAIAHEKLRVPENAIPEVVETCESVGSRPNIAVAWKTTNQVQGRSRNLPLDRFSETIANKDAVWHVAQHGEISEDVQFISQCAPNAKIAVNTLAPKGDMLTLATALIRMDAVVTIDNTLLHLAGSLGIRTLAMISIPGYWAWPTHGQSSRWYDSVEIVRQSQPGVWTDVLDVVDRELGDPK